MSQVVLPNIKKLFIPDPGYVWFDCDLKGADAQVVAWEAEDEDLKAAFRAGRDIHAHNAEAMWGAEFTRLTSETPPWKKKRQSCKHAVHGTNYVGSANAVARHPLVNWTIHETEKFQARWFSIHPQIKLWQQGVQKKLDVNRTITNGFGYRRVFFDRPDACLPEAVAWSPQSTVALTAFFGALQLERRASWVEILLNNHDSFCLQVPEKYANEIATIKEGLSVTIPFPDPLTIPWGISKSSISWGDCKKIEGT